MPQPPPNAAGRIVGILIIFLYLYSAPDPYSNSPVSGFHSPRDQFNAHLARQREAYQVLNTSRYGDFRPESGGHWLNLTGFKQDDGYAWEILASVKEKVEKEREALMGVEVHKGEPLGLYRNVTGIVQGTWVRSPLENEALFSSGKQRLNLTEIAPGAHWGDNRWDRNITGKEGTLLLNLDEKDRSSGLKKYESVGSNSTESFEGSLRDVSATMTIGDESTSGDGWEMRLHGVHWPQQGAMVLTTTSAKFAGIYGLPNLMTSKSEFDSSKRLLNKTLDDALKKKENSAWIDLSLPWSTDDSMPAPHCEYVIYVQVHPIRQNEFQGPIAGPLKDDLGMMMGDIEAELRYPNGAPILEPPSLKMSMTAFSPDCGFILESKGPPAYSPSEGHHLRGLKQEVFVARIKHWSLIWGLALFGQVLLIRMQMKESSTPSTLSRISYYTIAMMLCADLLLFGSLMIFSGWAPVVFPTATLAAFAVSLSIGLGVRFLADVYNVQEPERRERERQRAQAAPPRQISGAATPVIAPIITAVGAESLPLPVTAARPAAINDAPIIIPSDQDIDAEIAGAVNTAVGLPITNQNPTAPADQPRFASEYAASYGQYALAFTCFFLFTLSSSSWPTILREVYVNTLSITYLSFWTPQIYRNVIRNCRKAFKWKFIIGQSILRAIPFAYFYLREDNVLFAQTKSLTMMVLAGWLWVQIWILAAQEVLGPRFGLPKGWLPEAWDYHPILREDDAEGGGMPIGLVQAPGSPSLERVRTGEEGRKKSDGHTWSVDCAICMQVLEVPIVPTGGDGPGTVGGGAGGVAGILARRLYMVTPCRHAFHSACLEGWMRFRLQCPICRENLPPL